MPNTDRHGRPTSPRQRAVALCAPVCGAIALLAALAGGPAAQPQTPAPAITPPVDLRAADNPDDAGHGILLTWRASPDSARVRAYEIYRLPWRPAAAGPAPAPELAPDSAWILLAAVPAGDHQYVQKDDERTLGDHPNPKYVPRGQPVYYRLRARGDGGAFSAFTPPVAGVAIGNWIHSGRYNVAVIALLLGSLMVYFIQTSRRGAKLYIRPIPGLSRIDEAIGRATEMGRPILFVLGTGTAGDIATLAGYTILARVAKRTAEYQTPLLVPVNEPVMMVMARGTVKEAYMEAGRPDVYNPENIFYISAMQFPYVAAVNGLMLRQRTATNFYMGVFHAESLLLAEAGSTTGAIQISGTDQVAQIPFFVAATDYTLIGEELYAASAYLSQDPKLVGPLKAQDLVKTIILLVAIAGVIEVTVLGTGLIRQLIAPH